MRKASSISPANRSKLNSKSNQKNNKLNSEDKGKPLNQGAANNPLFSLKYDDELEIMKTTHKILLYKQRMQEPRDMIDKLLVPVIEQIPKLKKEFATCQAELELAKSAVKNFNGEMIQFREQVREFAGYEGEIQRLKHFIERVNDEHLQKERDIETRLNAFKENIQDFKLANDAHQLKLCQYSVRIDEAMEKIEHHYEETGYNFDRWHREMGETVKGMIGRQDKIEGIHGSLVEDMKQFKEYCAVQIETVIGDLIGIKDADERKFQGMNKRMVKIDNQLRMIKTLDNNISEIKRTLAKNDYQPKFLSQTLPALIHLSICEALEKVVGEDYKQPLMTFEREKMAQIQHYVHRYASPNCIYVMHQRLLFLIKWFATRDKGVMPFAYGEDVSDELPLDEITYISPGYERKYNERHEKMQAQAIALREALDQALADKFKQSEVVLQHKLERLQPFQLIQLRNRVLLFKVHQHKRLEDVMLEKPLSMQPKKTVRRIRAESTDDDAAQGGGGQGVAAPSTVNINYPQAMFNIKRERLRPYQRLDKKYQALFQTAYQDIKAFKDAEIANFTKTIQMTMGVNADLENVKTVVVNIQRQAEETEEKLLDKIENMNTKLEGQELDFDKLNNRTRVNERDINKLQKDSEEKELQIATQQHVITGYDGDFDRLDEEIKQLKELMEENGNYIDAQFKRIIAKSNKQQSALNQQLQGQEQRQREMSAELHRELDEHEQKFGTIEENKENITAIGTTLKLHLQCQVDKNSSMNVDTPKSPSKARKHMAIQEGSSPDSPTKQDPPSEDTISLRDTTRKKREGDQRSDNNDGKVENVAPANEEDDIKSKLPKGQKPTLKKQGAASAIKGKQTSQTNEKEQSKAEQSRKARGEQIKEKKRKEDLAKQRQKEREVREEKAKIEKEEKQKALEKQKAIDDKKRQAELEIQGKIAQRKKLMMQLQQKSNTTALSEKFLENLGDQKVASEKMKDKVVKMNKQLNDKVKLAIKNQSSVLDVKDKKEKTDKIQQKPLLNKVQNEEAIVENGHQRKKQPQKVIKDNRPSDDLMDNSEINETENEGDTTEYEDVQEVDARFVNPFSLAFREQKQRQNGIDLPKLKEYITPKLDEINDLIKQQQLKTEDKFKEVDNIIDDKLTVQLGEVLKQIGIMQQNHEKDNDSFREFKDAYNKFKTSMEFEQQQLADIVENEKKEIVKLRRNIKYEIQCEIVKIQEQDCHNIKEFKRINSYIESTHHLLTHLLEDSLIGQMLQEQEIIDRKQISLFGLKTNQQILGSNQYAATNNLSPGKPKGQSSFNVNREESPFSECSETDEKPKDFWKHRNKNKEYKSIIKRPIKTGSSARGSDMAKNKLDQIQISHLNQSIAVQSPNTLSPKQTSPPKVNSLIGQYHNQDQQLFSHRVRRQRFDYDIVNDSSQPLADRISASNVNPYNTLFIDRNCANCMKDSIPQVLSHIKMACLSYVNSPIKYTVPRIGTQGANLSNMAELQFTDLILIKEYLLVKAQSYMDQCKTIMNETTSHYGGMDAAKRSRAVTKVFQRDGQSLNASTADDQHNDSLGDGTQRKQPTPVDDQSPKSVIKDIDNQNEEFGCTMSLDDNTASVIVKLPDDKGQGSIDKIGDHFDESRVKCADMQNANIDLQSRLSTLNSDLRLDKNLNPQIRNPEFSTQKFKIRILEDFIRIQSAKNQKVSVDQYMKRLMQTQLEKKKARIKQSYLIQEKTYKLGNLQELENGRNNFQAILDQQPFREQLQAQYLNYDKKSNIRKMIPSMVDKNRQDPKLVDIMKRSLKVTPTSRQSTFSSLINRTENNRISAYHHPRPDSMSNDVDRRNNFTTVAEDSYEPHQPDLQIHIQEKQLSREHSQARDYDESPNHVSLTNSIWPRTTKNARYETLLHDPQHTVSNGSVNKRSSLQTSNVRSQNGLLNINLTDPTQQDTATIMQTPTSCTGQINSTTRSKQRPAIKTENTHRKKNKQENHKK